jgi:hypothetical protein
MAIMYISISFLFVALLSRVPIQVWFRQQQCINSIRKLYIKLKSAPKNSDLDESQIILRGITRVYLKSLTQFFKRVQHRQEYKVLIERQFKHLFKELAFIKARHQEFNKNENLLMQDLETQITKFHKLYEQSNAHWLLKY